MAERYRDHLIFVRTVLDPQTRLWTASAHVQFNEGPRIFQDISLPRATALFETEKAAERYTIRQARNWIDERLGRTEQQPLFRKLTLGSFRRALISFLAALRAKANETNSS